VMTFLHSVFALAVRKGWAPSNPVQDAARPRRRRAGDASPDLQFLTLDGLDRVIDVIPDRTVDRDALGPVVRLIVLAAGTTGLRQSELLGSRWRDVEPGNSSYSASPRSGMHPPTLVPLEYQRSRRRLGRASHASPRAGLAGDEIASLRSSSVPLQLHFGSPLDLVVSGVIAP
jgi:integrase